MLADGDTGSKSLLNDVKLRAGEFNAVTYKSDLSVVDEDAELLEEKILSFGDDGRDGIVPIRESVGLGCDNNELRLDGDGLAGKNDDSMLSIDGLGEGRELEIENVVSVLGDGEGNLLVIFGRGDPTGEVGTFISRLGKILFAIE